VRNLIGFLKTVVDEINPEVRIDYHGHRDRGMDILNTLAALEAGADRVHACALGLGERCGNTSMELLLVNLNLLGIAQRDLTRLPEYCELVSQMCRVAIPNNYPVVGADAFRTATGVHAAAVAKALNAGDGWLADRVYSSVPASMVGREQVIEIGPMSGLNNVRFWLRQRGIAEQPDLVERIFAAAKRADRVLPEAEVMRIVAETRP
jgi:2-isopropylmalate synthase